MDKERIFKKMKTWNMILIVIGIIAILGSIYSLVNELTMDWDTSLMSSKEIYDQMGLSIESINLESLKPTTFTIIQNIIIILIMIYIVFVAIKNNQKINNKESINTLPYILKLILFAYNCVISIITLSGFSGMLPEEAASVMMFMLIFLAIAFAIYFIFALLPSIRLLMLSNKLNKLEEDN